jgi:hypothetical protein
VQAVELTLGFAEAGAESTTDVTRISRHVNSGAVFLR